MNRNVAGRVAWALVLTLVGASGARAQDAAPPKTPATQSPVVRAYKTNIADEDWSFLADKTLRQDWLDPVKYVPLWGNHSYLTFGGEARIRPEGLRLRGAPGQDSPVDNYVFQRYLFATDWHIGRRFRVYGEVQSGLIDGKGGSPRPTDRNVADLHQGFVEIRTPKERPHQFLVRAGRQEMTIGSSRLISASQGLNVKRSFDGVVAGYDVGRWHLEGGSARLVAVGGGAFDDRSTWEQEFWGASLQRARLGFNGGTGAVYYLGVNREQSLYVQGAGAEQRHTIGGKFAGQWKAFDFSYDLIGQWGEFDHASVRAWGTALESGVRIRSWPLRPRFTLRINAATGDRDPADPRLQAFNPLFPGSSYSGLVGLLGPTNLTDFTPGVQLVLPRRVVVIFESPSYFRSSLRDGVYNIELRPLPLSPASPERYVGTNPAVVAIWNATRHVNLTGVITRFIPGAFVDGTFLTHGFGFYSSSLTYRF
jgi:hypothetical protein